LKSRSIRVHPFGESNNISNKKSVRSCLSLPSSVPARAGDSSFPPKDLSGKQAGSVKICFFSANMCLLLALPACRQTGCLSIVFSIFNRKSFYLSPIICTTTLRFRGRLSKSITTICCHVPNRSLPLSKGTVNEDPSMAART